MNQIEWGHGWYYGRLDPGQRQIYRQLSDCWHSGGDTVRIDAADAGALERIAEYVLLDDPWLFQVDPSHIRFRREGGAVTVQVRSLYSPEEQMRLRDRLERRIEGILEQTRACRTDPERLRFLHDYLADSITYHPGTAEAVSRRESHTIVGALLSSACVCDGYARAFGLLCGRLGLPCVLVTGESTRPEHLCRHAWNLVRLEGQVRHVDVTWDSIEDTDRYYLRTDSFFAREHRWDTGGFPAAEP